MCIARRHEPRSEALGAPGVTRHQLQSVQPTASRRGGRSDAPHPQVTAVDAGGTVACHSRTASASAEASTSVAPVMFAFSIFGLSEGLSVALVYVAGFLTLPFGLLLSEVWSDWRSRRRAERTADLDAAVSDGPVSAGRLVLCDYIDEKKLASIAKQQGIDPEPTRLERGSSTTRAADAGAGGHGARLGMRRERQRDEREWFDIERDPNAVLRAVLGRLEGASQVDRSVGTMPILGLDDDTLGRLRDAKQGESVDDLRERMIVAEKCREFEGILERSPFVLIDGNWRVGADAGVISMTLGSLQPTYTSHEYGRGPDGTAPIAMPGALSITAAFPENDLIDKAKARLTNGATVRAGVLATVAIYRDGQLKLAAIAVFGSHGSARYDEGLGC